MGLISGMLMGMVFGVALMVGWRHMIRYRSSKRIAKAADIKSLSSLNRDDLRKICGENFPEWISFPVFEQVKWLNKQLSKLWPFVADVCFFSFINNHLALICVTHGHSLVFQY
ncbi:unnamed protein product [Fraxinus pennsylvanica]|uniref:Uncharacterized protein n=1 Tax=Fraxinus pennsylvanica TaxID=56036 RepID=A0AAD1ZH89_9LAMI|nr:unnamed protein product [Fraxinus pennsylvanica]